ncbi:Hsp20/alpha crystallin family protein [Streptomyces halobius]|uniref:Hsp20/alpha crystallin family protein n=1 Tax=Streptomyces halobius TaxID=2879846 RepID=A0ABY4LZB2_9ACTN|nr:Hsp20/alpha crystallin family protein [Streptomyces halobius]UQA90845.1 Hsp20/alpha crystallin family protein [Streptomyces halobius]
MTLPIRHRPGSLERGFRWPEPMAADFEDLFERMNEFLGSATSRPFLAEPMTWSPLADMHETDEAYEIECELPGIRREDIDIEVSEHDLCVSGELKEREHAGVLRRRGRPTGRFTYRTSLPAGVKTDDVTASLADGVLTVTIPKAQVAKPRHIEIKG